MDLHATYPAVDDLAAAARRRIPRFVWEYLDCGTGRDRTLARNRDALDRIGFPPSILHGEIACDLSARFLEQDFPLPFGFAPVGMSGLIWPGAERILARTAAKSGIPFCISTVATQSPEDMAGEIGDHAWFQLYAPRDPGIRSDMLKRIADSGFRALVLTVDSPVAARRERQARSGLTQPPRLTPRLLAQVAMRPSWALATLRGGMPRMRTLDKYITGERGILPSTAHIGHLLRTSPDWDYLSWLRENWEGHLIVKGVTRAADAPRLKEAGVDAIWLSNHAGRQLDAAHATIESLPALRHATDLPIVFDGGIEGGVDIMRAFALGADFVMLGRAAHFAVAALGERGPAHLVDILAADLRANMGQTGSQSLRDLPPTTAL